MFNGFIISTIMNREDKAFKEFVGKASSFSFNSGIKISVLDNFSALLQNELQHLKKSARFLLQAKHRSILLVKNQTTSLPSDIFKWMRNCGVSFEHIQRIIPLDLITNFDVAMITDFVLQNKFSGRYKIFFEGRLCPDNLKIEIFKVIIPLITNKVDLDNPDYVVCVQAFKSFVGISILVNDSNNFNFSTSLNKLPI
ncbi:hypothetical protein GINT2_000794 [Glugoides intestinalis]